MTGRQQLVRYLDEYLRLDAIPDYGPQGLQVETDNETIRRIALSVDVSPPIIEAAAAWQADMLLVHHGLFWGSVEKLAGPLGVRVRALYRSGINLYAAHLPLDAHPEVGNNAVLAGMFGLRELIWWAEVKGTLLGVSGRINTQPLTAFVARVDEVLDTRSRLLAHGPETVSRVAILSGFGADEVEAAAATGADTYLTGETSHAQYWHAADHGLNVIFAGHYATETVGVRALGDHLAQKFDVAVRFFDFPTEM